MNAFDSIIGYETEKKELKRICDMLIDEEKYKKLGVTCPAALLIHGRPGLGKSLMARALAQSSRRVVYSCSKNAPEGSFVNIIRETFENAARNAPSVVLLDDMDKFAEDNGGSDSNKEEFVIIQTCLEEIAEKNKSVFVIATANDIDDLPESLLRAGRFGRQLHIKPPSIADATRIIKAYLKNKPVSEDVSPELIANMIAGESCAMLKEVLNEAGMYAGYEGESAIGRRHILEAIMKLVYHSRMEDNPDEEMLRIFSCHEAGHAVARLAGETEVAFLSILFGQSGGICGVCRSVSDGWETPWSLEDLKKEIMIKLAGKAAEEVILGTVSFGAQSDLDEAVQELRIAVEKLMAFGFEYGYDFRRHDEKQACARQEKVSDKIFAVLNEWYGETVEMIKDWRPVVEALMAGLIENKYLLRDDVNRIVSAGRIDAGGPRG